MREFYENYNVKVYIPRINSIFNYLEESKIDTKQQVQKEQPERLNGFNEYVEDSKKLNLPPLFQPNSHTTLHSRQSQYQEKDLIG